VGPLTVYYDDRCDMCIVAAQAAERHDRARRIRWRGIAASGAPIERAEAVGEMHAVDGSGHVYRGYDAVVAIAAALPRLRPLARLLDARWVHPVGSRVYRLVARRRRRR
jgi:predicted DCC family thiol-disulfide oxidoreductase YuxK